MPDTVLQIKITLSEIQPLIWRRIHVLSVMKLSKLHYVLQDVMGWQDSHLHSFKVNGDEYCNPAQDKDRELNFKDERKLNLLQIFKKTKTFHYLYDFGDGWVHELTIENESQPKPEVTYPICIGGQRACPPEDCGGPHGYQRFLEILVDPNHEEHEEKKTWIGGFFDSESFDPNQVNKELRKRRAW